MKKRYANYGIIALLLIIISLVIASCGGSDEGGYIAPNLTQESETVQLVSKDVKGFLYHSSSLSSSEAGEEEEIFSVLDIPVTGEDGFLEQLDEYVTETSLKTDSGDLAELLSVFRQEAFQYQPLPAWQSSVLVSGLYDDSTVPLNSDGSFAGTVSAAVTDETVGLEIFLSEGNCYEVETVSESDISASHGSSVDSIKSCPSQIIIKPGECRVFEVFSKNLNFKDANLAFTIQNPEFGCICGPLYLRCNGSKKYNIAYGIIYVKKGMDTPLETSIKAETSQGHSLSIPVQIVKKTASVSGKVNTGGVTLVKGYVKSMGPKACCKLDEQGNYVLPKVFQGSQRKVIATWWTLEGGKNVKHREVKYIDLYGDMTGVDFGVVLPGPTPTMRPPEDLFYDKCISEIMYFYGEWKEQYGYEGAIERVLDWLNRKDPSAPPVRPEIVDAYLGPGYETEIWINFTDGYGVALWLPPVTVPMTSMDASAGFSENTELPDLPLQSTVSSSDNGRVIPHSSNVLILAPFVFEHQVLSKANGHSTILPPGTDVFKYRVFSHLEYELRSAGYEVKSIVTTDQDMEMLHTTYEDEFYPEASHEVHVMNMKPGKEDNFVRPWDFVDLNNYGVIYISTHGGGLSDPDNDPNSFGTENNWDGILCGPYCKNDGDLHVWTLLNRYRYYKFVPSDPNNPNDPNDPGDPNSLWTNGCWSMVYWGDKIGAPYRTIRLTRKFLEPHASNVTNSIIYMDACYSGDLRNIFTGPGKNNVYLCYNKSAFQHWAGTVSYYFFYYMMFGFTEPKEVPEYKPVAKETPSPPVSAREAYDALVDYGVSQDPFPYDAFPAIHCDPNDPNAINKIPYINCKLEIEGDPNSDTYFPVPVTVIVSEE